MNHTPMNQTIALNKLILSPHNVRRTNGSEDIEGLAQSIHSNGLLQNLVVSQSVDQPDKYEVDAGGRRWRALNMLANQKRIARTFPVPVQIISRDDALEVSLLENLQKVAMNPADEVEAFQAIINAGGDEGHGGIDDMPNRTANCARRFGRSQRYVEQRLRLASLAPDILTALREYRITIEAARAYASHPDPIAQLAVFQREDEKGQWGHKPQNIRDALAGKSYPFDHHLVRYIGLQAYIDAGGRTERDLFFGDHDREILIDTDLVKPLATKKAHAQAEYQARKAGFSAVAISPVDGPSHALPKSPKGFERSWLPNVVDLPSPEKAGAIAIYRINDEADCVEIIKNQFFKPVSPAGAAASEAGRRSVAVARDWAAEYREKEIRTIAARLAAEPAMKGTPLKGRAHWPSSDVSWIQPLFETDEGEVWVALMVRVDTADIDAQIAQAEQDYEAIKAQQQAEKDAAGTATKTGLVGIEPITTAVDQAEAEEPVA